MLFNSSLFILLLYSDKSNPLKSSSNFLHFEYSIHFEIKLYIESIFDLFEFSNNTFIIFGICKIFISKITKFLDKSIVLLYNFLSILELNNIVFIKDFKFSLFSTNFSFILFSCDLLKNISLISSLQFPIINVVK